MARRKVKEASRASSPWRRVGAPRASAALEELENCARPGIGDRQRLHAELLLDLERLQVGAFLGEVSVDQVAETFLENVDELAREIGLDFDPLRGRAERCQLVRTAESMAVSATAAPELVLMTLDAIPSEEVSSVCALTLMTLPSTVLSTVRSVAAEVIRFLPLNSAVSTIVVI